LSIAIDTNVLVRYLTWDNEAQAELAAAVIEDGETIAISTIVLCELAWVLKRAYRYQPDEIADAIQRIITSRNVDVDRPAAEAGLRLLDRGGDFADGVVCTDTTRTKCRCVATFDRDFARLLEPDQVMLLQTPE
jgi:predicted nucleic-acid-binding protein